MEKVGSLIQTFNQCDTLVGVTESIDSYVGIPSSNRRLQLSIVGDKKRPLESESSVSRDNSEENDTEEVTCFTVMKGILIGSCRLLFLN